MNTPFDFVITLKKVMLSSAGHNLAIDVHSFEAPLPELSQILFAHICGVAFCFFPSPKKKKNGDEQKSLLTEKKIKNRINLIRF